MSTHGALPKKSWSPNEIKSCVLRVLAPYNGDKKYKNFKDKKHANNNEVKQNLKIK